MIFSSIEFFIFFAIYYVLFLLLKNRGNLYLGFVLIASYYFYMSWVPKFIFILLATTILDYSLGIAISRSKTPMMKRLLLIGSITANLFLLGFFKYADFFIDNFNAIAGLIHPQGRELGHLNMLMPLGISFFTFKSMSYTIDIYNGKIPAERNILRFAAFVSFFPELVAGPIVRAEKLIPQFYEKVHPTVKGFVDGLKLFVIGFFKKLFIADMISPYSDNAFAHYKVLTGYEIWIGVLAYTVQIYCDFSGYTDMAIGIARMMGYAFPENFNIPYLSKSVSEFWRRWHISLSSWFNDYLFMPIASRWSKWGDPGIVLSTLVTFILIGFWHGPSWKFVVFGFLQGVAIAFEFVFKKPRRRFFKLLPERLGGLLGIILTVGYFTFSGIFFRANSLADAFAVIGRLGSIQMKQVYYMPQFYFLVFIFILGHILYGYFYDKNKQWKQSKFLEICFYLWIIVMMILLAPTHTSPFVYFQF
jgi:D-alanyl-lipoteichoic acid acyltransferase DltB (MBOAT superfamily)